MAHKFILVKLIYWAVTQFYELELVCLLIETSTSVYIVFGLSHLIWSSFFNNKMLLLYRRLILACDDVNKTNHLSLCTRFVPENMASLGNTVGKMSF